MKEFKDIKDARALVYAFVALPHVTRMSIARMFVEVTAEESSALNQTETSRIILTRIHDADKLADFSHEVFKAKAELKDVF